MDAHPSQEIAFSATLTLRQRRLAGRLEGFGDIVFGFAVSQCALQLPTASGHVDFARPIALLFYFATFAVVASLWLIFHRMMAGTYVPANVDLFLAFAYLALVSLIPFGMYAIVHEIPTLERATSVLGEYTGLYATMTLIAAILSMRNLRRGYFYLSDDDRRQAWIAFVRQAMLCVMMIGALAIDRVFGPNWAGLFLVFIVPAIRLARSIFSRAPSAEALRIATAVPDASQRAS
jgi:uncharacterized membrane protein